MASVWCAEDRLLGRSVAVKVLAERFAHDEFAVRRFKREARTAARVSAHPHVVTIFDVGDIEPREDELIEGQHPPARAFIVMEFLAGGTVADAIRVGAVERDQALLWLDQAASALDHAHQRGIVHRDIKPANFLLDNSRSLHVADFGIARLQSEDTITSTGQLFGTAAYLSPEQALGREATSASDLYALAVATFELLAGERPFRATNFAAQARQHVEDRPPRASQCERALPAAVDPVLSRGMAKDPEARYETAGAFVEALKDSLDGPPTAMTRPFPAGGAPQTREPSQTRRRAAGHSASPIVPVSGSSRRSGRMAALAALLVAVAGVALVAILGQVGGGNTAGKRVAGSSSTAAKHKAAGHRAHTPRPAQPASTSASASSSTTATASSSAAPTSAAGLQALGHQQLDAGNYSAAISTLHQALHAADPSSLTYAYALYDLGRALMLSGDPKDAIPVLEQRLQIHDQTGVVQQTLDQARREAGVAAPAPTSSLSTPTPTPPTAPKHHKHHGPGPGPGHGNGGAGLPGSGGGDGGGD